MPKVVDHAQRQQELAEAVWRVINRVGLEGTTTRLIAAEAGYSRGAVAHYFSSKDEILRAALVRANNVICNSVERMPPQSHPVTRLRHALSEALPLDDRRSFTLRLDVHFWARSLNEVSMQALQQKDRASWRATMVRLVADAQAVGAIDTERPVEDLADLLTAFIDGIGMQGLVFPEVITAERIRNLFDSLLMSLGADPTYLVELDEAPRPPCGTDRQTARSR